MEFIINEELTAKCEREDTRSGFRHVGTLYRLGEHVESDKCNYLNRTWESYEFESMLESLAESDEIDETERAQFKAKIAGQFRKDDPAMAQLKSVGMVAALGNMFADKDQSARNDWKERMLKAGLKDNGLIMPDDWDQLDEAEKERRLDGVIDQLV